MNIPAPFTENQLTYFKKCFSSWFNVAEGGKRGGKNVLQTLAFCASLEVHPNRLHLIAGVSQTTAKLNILDCDGYGLQNYFEGRCREGKYKDRACLYVQTKTGEKVILISGGGKSGDEKYIKGNTYGMAYVTEANECHPNFIQEVFDRTLSSDDRKIFHDLNPKAPHHWYYENVLSFHEERQKIHKDYGYNYGHFTVADNLSVSNTKLKTILSTYDRNSVWYKRDILGERTIAEGLIYSTFANNEADYFISKDKLPKFDYIFIGVDFGGSGSQHAFCATGINLKERKIYVLRSRSIMAKGTSVSDIVKHFKMFADSVVKDFGDIDAVYADSAEQAIINEMKNQTNYSIRNSIKNEIIDRIRCTDLMLSGKRLFIVESENDSLCAGLREAVWDSKDPQEDVRLDDGASNIDILDAFEYSWEKFIKQLI